MPAGNIIPKQRVPAFPERTVGDSSLPAGNIDEEETPQLSKENLENLPSSASNNKEEVPVPQDDDTTVSETSVNTVRAQPSSPTEFPVPTEIPEPTEITDPMLSVPTEVPTDEENIGKP